MTVQEASNKLGVSKWALYKMIKQKRGVGAYFKKNKFGVWVVDGRRITRC